LLDGIVVTPSQILVKCNKDSIRQFPYDILQDVVVINRLIFTLKYAREDPTNNGLNLKRKENISSFSSSSLNAALSLSTFITKDRLIFTRLPHSSEKFLKSLTLLRYKGRGTFNH
jgi:uncharacterized protein YdaL